ncbi:MAG: cysteine--tRNA ligase [Phycisphaerae bacterium]
MTLQVYNTLTRKKELFEPLTPGRVGMYLCGPTVYRPAHIGHAVGPVIFDTIKRYLVYKGFEVRWVVNVTDVEDKIIAEAAARGVGAMRLARGLEEQYKAAMSRLGVRSIDAMPRASEYIPGMIEHIQALVARDLAYVLDGDVYFDVARDDDYGKLSNRKADDQLAGTRDGLVQKGKRNAGDFALWKAAKPSEPDEVKFDSPWGSGRPGWHIECSVMAARLLGETFDIHGGGMDLIFPHHENEIAQSESHSGKPFARYWLHHGLTRFNTKKISKSDADMQSAMAELELGSLLARHPAERLRFLIISSHYRAPIEFSPASLEAARKGLETFQRLFERIERICGRNPVTQPERIEQRREQATAGAEAAFFAQVLAFQLRFLEAMDDDFNTAAAIGVLFELAGAINRFVEQANLEVSRDARLGSLAEGAAGTLVTLGRLLGLFETLPDRAGAAGGQVDELMRLLIDVRAMARQAKQFAIADEIRTRLDALGLLLEDRADTTTWRAK